MPSARETHTLLGRRVPYSPRGQYEGSYGMPGPVGLGEVGDRNLVDVRVVGEWPDCVDRLNVLIGGSRTLSFLKHDWRELRELMLGADCLPTADTYYQTVQFEFVANPHAPEPEDDVEHATVRKFVYDPDGDTFEHDPGSYHDPDTFELYPSDCDSDDGGDEGGDEVWVRLADGRRVLGTVCEPPRPRFQPRRGRYVDEAVTRRFVTLPDVQITFEEAPRAASEYREVPFKQPLWLTAERAAELERCGHKPLEVVDGVRGAPPGTKLAWVRNLLRVTSGLGGPAFSLT